MSWCCTSCWLSKKESSALAPAALLATRARRAEEDPVLLESLLGALATAAERCGRPPPVSPSRRAHYSPGYRAFLGTTMYHSQFVQGPLRRERTQVGHGRVFALTDEVVKAAEALRSTYVELLDALVPLNGQRGRRCACSGRCQAVARWRAFDGAYADHEVAMVEFLEEMSDQGRVLLRSLCDAGAGLCANPSPEARAAAVTQVMALNELINPSACSALLPELWTTCLEVAGTAPKGSFVSCVARKATVRLCAVVELVLQRGADNFGRQDGTLGSERELQRLVALWEESWLLAQGVLSVDSRIAAAADAVADELKKQASEGDARVAMDSFDSEVLMHVARLSVSLFHLSHPLHLFLMGKEEHIAVSGDASGSDSDSTRSWSSNEQAASKAAPAHGECSLTSREPARAFMIPSKKASRSPVSVVAEVPPRLGDLINPTRERQAMSLQRGMPVRWNRFLRAWIEFAVESPM
mmetsp:Transcript_103610/g.237242  ORF Transcript_103610/g.237242 Transcript_103610/m.237242 type:complete len:469 (+) Transcript_103610:407-1813(+)